MTDIIVSPEEFDIDRLIVKPPEDKSFTTKDKRSIMLITSDVVYLDEDGTECNFYFTAPTQKCYGVNYKYKYQAPMEPQYIEGLQATYPVTSNETVDNPTEEEQAFDEMMMAMHQKFVDSVKEHSDSDLIPEKALGCISNKKYVKLPYDWKKTPVDPKRPSGRKMPDTSRPKTFYVDILTNQNAKTKKLSVQTPFYGPGDEEVPAEALVSKPGEYTFGFGIQKLNYAAQGSADYAAKAKFFVAECTVIPSAMGTKKLPNKRLLKNVPGERGAFAAFSSPEAEAEENGPDYTMEAEGFESGSEDVMDIDEPEETPKEVKKLNRVVKNKAPAKKVKATPKAVPKAAPPKAKVIKKPIKSGTTKKIVRKVKSD